MNSAASCWLWRSPGGATRWLFNTDTASLNAAGFNTLCFPGLSLQIVKSSTKLLRSTDSATEQSISSFISLERSFTRQGLRDRHCTTLFIKHRFWPSFFKPAGLLVQLPPKPSAEANLLVSDWLAPGYDGNDTGLNDEFVLKGRLLRSLLLNQLEAARFVVCWNTGMLAWVTEATLVWSGWLW